MAGSTQLSSYDVNLSHNPITDAVAAKKKVLIEGQGASATADVLAWAEHMKREAGTKQKIDDMIKAKIALLKKNYDSISIMKFDGPRNRGGAFDPQKQKEKAAAKMALDALNKEKLEGEHD